MFQIETFIDGEHKNGSLSLLRKLFSYDLYNYCFLEYLIMSGTFLFFIIIPQFLFVEHLIFQEEQLTPDFGFILVCIFLSPNTKSPTSLDPIKKSDAEKSQSSS